MRTGLYRALPKENVLAKLSKLKDSVTNSNCTEVATPAKVLTIFYEINPLNTMKEVKAILWQSKKRILVRNEV